MIEEEPPMATQFAIIRTEKHKSWSTLSKSMGHTMRTSGDDRQHLKAVDDPVVVLTGSHNWLSEWREQVNGMHLRRLPQGCQHTLAREFFLGMSPQWAEGKTRAEIDAWAAANIAWLEQRFGKERVKFAALHLDEQTPHIAAYVVPLKADLNRKGEPNPRGNGWTLSDQTLGLGGNKVALVKLQDEYAEAMKPQQLTRGRRGSKATHQKTAEWRAQMARPLEKSIVKPRIPDPTMADRFDPKAYAKQAADAAARAVFDQMKPHYQQAKAQAKQLREQSKELHELRGMVEHLQPLADMLRVLYEAVFGAPMDLNTIHGQQTAQEAIKRVIEERKAQKKAQKAAQATEAPALKAQKAVQATEEPALEPVELPTDWDDSGGSSVPPL
jgi:hypothetical protein